MATKGNTIGAGIVLDGEREFKQALRDIDNGLKVTTSELQLLTAQYSSNGNSVKALTDKGIVLENKISSQTEKIAKLREALAASAANYGEADAKTMKWQVSLNNAEAELYKMQGDLRKNSEALETARANMQKYGLAADEAAKQSGGLGSKLSGLAGTLGVNLPAGAEAAIKSLDNMKLSTMALVGITAGIITGLSKATIAAADFADEILETASETGLTTDTIQELKYAAEFVDVPFETMTGSMRKMVKAMGEAKAGNKEATESFRELHVGIYGANGQLKDSEEMFYQVIDALGRIPSETDRDVLAMKVFGKSAQELNPLIEAGSQRLRELGEEAEKLGIVMGKDNIESLEAFKDNLDKANAQMGAFKLNLGLGLLPILKSLFEILNKINPQTLATITIAAGIVVTIVTVVKLISSLVGVVNTFSMAGLKTTAIVVGVTAALIALAAIIAVIIGKGSDLDRTIANVGNAVGNMASTVNGAGNKVKYSYASGIDYVPSDRIALIHKGERVQRADENPYNPSARNTKTYTSAATGDTYIFQPGSITIDAEKVEDFNSVVAIFSDLKQKKRQGGVAFVRS